MVWSFKAFIGEDWLWRNAHKAETRDTRFWKPAEVPGSVQNDLWAAGEIPDPYHERNSLLIEWVPERTWLYKRSFAAIPLDPGQQAWLRFEGVDYECQVFVNGEAAGKHLGMYTPALMEVTHLLHPDRENLLAVVIEAAPKEQPQVGKTSLVRTHKARMSYWWDFCPRMIHLGIWDRVSLEITGGVRIEDLWVRCRLNPHLTRAVAAVQVMFSSRKEADIHSELVIRQGGQVVGRVEKNHHLYVGESREEYSLEVEDPQLWWPNGYGEPALYEASLRIAELINGTAVLSDSRVVTFGIREIHFATNPSGDPQARPFVMMVNGRRIYMKGWNWVPLDVLYGVERPAKQERLIELAKRAEVNLLRVWGGGLIEKESFYELCDRMGILVWQELIQSSSGIENRPCAEPDFIDFMAGQVREIVPRKRNHPSLAIWCGGNELQTGSEQPCDSTHPLLQRLENEIRELDPERAWFATSPSGGVFSNNLENLKLNPLRLHDVHGPWEFQGLAEHFELYNQGSCLLHSEFGVEGLTNLKTLESVMEGENRWPVTRDNPTWFHLGAWWVKEKMWEQVFGEIPDLDRQVRAIQMMQAEGLRYAVEANRRRAYQNSGSLPWQFNEPYPMAACTSAVDYYARPKPVYYGVARAYAPLSVTARFEKMNWSGEKIFRAQVWTANTTGTQTPSATLCARLVGLGGEGLGERVFPAEVPVDGSQPAGTFEMPLREAEDAVFFFDLELYSADEKRMAGNRYLFSRTENLNPLFSIPVTQLECTWQEPDEDTRIVTVANRGTWTAVYVWLEDERLLDADGYVYFSDNHFCLFPGETRRVRVDFQGVAEDERCVAVSAWNTGKYYLSDDAMERVSALPPLQDLRPAPAA